MFPQVMDCAGKHQVLIFVHSRKETFKTAKFLKDEALQNDKLAQFIGTSGATRELLQSESETTKNTQLKELLPFGFAVHHAGMSRPDRTTVEDLFAEGHVQVCFGVAKKYMLGVWSLGADEEFVC